MELSDMFRLKWNDFTNNVADTFRSLRGENDFTDVTLACEDGLVLEAHKVILAASSSFFLNILKMSKHPHPLIYLKGVQMRELAAVVDFLYCGEVSVKQEELESFFALARDLGLKVLDENLESGEVGGAFMVKQEVEIQTEVKSKSKSGADRTMLAQHEMQLQKTGGENLESGEVANSGVLVERGDFGQTRVKSKAKSAAERTRKWRERNKEGVKVGVLKYSRKTAEKRRTNSDFDKKFKEREARRKREWRKRNSTLSLETRIIT